MVSDRETADGLTTADDGVIRWEVLPGRRLSATTGVLAAQHETYRLCVMKRRVCAIPTGHTTPQPAEALAEFTATIGRLSPDTFAATHIFDGVAPMEVYFVGYRESGLWFWQQLEVPLEVIPAAASATGLTLQFDAAQCADVIGIRVLVTSAFGFRSDREHELDMLEICAESGLQLTSLRNLKTFTGYRIVAWPILHPRSARGREVAEAAAKPGTQRRLECATSGPFRDAFPDAHVPLGLRSLEVKMCTLPPAQLFVAEAGDTYLRLSLQRPRWAGPSQRDVSEYEARIGEVVLQLWEDPTWALRKNARRLAAGRMPQRYPLQRRSISMQEVPVGEQRDVVLEGLVPLRAHFIVLLTRTGTASWDEPVRLRVSTAGELAPVQRVVMTHSSALLAWHREPPPALPSCHLDVPFPSSVNLFDDREVPNPYVGDATVNLPNGAAWGKAEGLLHRVVGFEVSALDLAASSCTITKVTSPRVVLSHLAPSAAYYVRVRSVIEGEGRHGAPWGRPWLVLTPSDVLLRVVYRTATSLTIAWGRQPAPAVHPMPFPPGYQRYLPDINDEDGGYYYYYLEPLPYLPPDEGGVAPNEHDDASPLPLVRITSSSSSSSPAQRSGSSAQNGRGAQSPLPTSSAALAELGVDEAQLSAWSHASRRSSVAGREEAARVLQPPEDLSSSEEEEDTFADPTATGAFLGSRVKIVNREPKPKPLCDLPIVLADEPTSPSKQHGSKESHQDDDECGLAGDQEPPDVIALVPLVLLVLHGEVDDPWLEWMATHNYYNLELDEVLAERHVVAFHHEIHDVFGSVTIPDLQPSAALTAFLFRRASSRAPSVLVSKHFLRTLSQGTTIAHAPPAVDVTQAAMWFALAFERQLRESAEEATLLPHLSVVDVSEVFVTLCINVDVPAQVCDSVALTTLHAHAAAPAEAPVAEFLVRVVRVEMQSSTLVPVGDPKLVYFATQSSEIQIVDLSAASQYHLSVARMNNKTHQWTPWSPVLSLSTVQRLLMDIDEISSEYLTLKWGRNKMDSIIDFVVTISDLHHGHHPQLQLPSSGEVSASQREDEDAKKEVEGEEEQQQQVVHTREIVTRATSHRLAILRDLRHNGLFDCAVVPRYENGQNGLASNAVRFVQCTLAARVVECGVSHLYVQWDRANYPDAAGGSLMLRLRCGEGWERTAVLPGDATEHIFAQLEPLTEYSISVSFFAVVHMHRADPPDPQLVLRCTEPFSLRGKTLSQPSAEVHKLGESCVELTWVFHAEEEHEGDIVMEVQFVDRRKAEKFAVLATCHTVRGETVGRGRATIEGLLPERLYVVAMRQQYSRMTWGEWQQVLSGVSTLRRIEVAVTDIGCTFFNLRASRPLWTSSLGTHESMTRAEQINPPRWRFRLERLGADGGVRELESHVPHVLVSGLESNAPHAITVQQWSINDWGEPSLPVNLYTLQQLVPAVTVRADNYLAILPTRDRRLPAAATQLCTWHDEASAARLSSLVAVKIGARSLIDPHATAVELTVSGDEASITSTAVVLQGLLPAHPYRVDVSGVYTHELEPYVRSLATVTLSLPELHVINLGEDCFTLAWNAPKVQPAHYAAFSGLSADVRHAPRDGAVATVVRWEIRAVPAAATGGGSGAVADEGGPASLSSASTQQQQQPQQLAAAPAFQDPDITEIVVAVDEGVSQCTLSGLMPQTTYDVAIRSIDSAGHIGWFRASGFVKTTQFMQIHVNKLAENFAELAWDLPAWSRRGGDHKSGGGGGGGGAVAANGNTADAARRPGPSSAARRSRQLTGHAGAAQPGIIRDLVAAAAAGGDMESGAHALRTPQHFELLVLDLSQPAISEGGGDAEETPTTIVDIAAGCVFIENLKPRTRYAVIGRTHCEIDDGAKVLKGTWGPRQQFETLALLVLQVVHVGLDFVNVTWHGVEGDVENDAEEQERGAGIVCSSEESVPRKASIPMQRRRSRRTTLLPAHAEGGGDAASAAASAAATFEFPGVLLGSSTFFAVGSSGGSAGATASAVRFQLRAMDADPDGTIGGLKEDMFVTTSESNVHTIRNLQPKTAYAISMRVCYEGISGSWVDPAIVITDWVPAVKVLRITQGTGEFRYRVEHALHHPQIDEPVPPRRHRLYEIRIEEKFEEALAAAAAAAVAASDGEGDAPSPPPLQHSVVTVDQPTTLELTGLKRDFLYHVTLREVINGHNYGGFTPLTAFWTQPYPPIITELLECRDGFAEIRWGVMNNDRVGEILSGDAVPPGFVYCLERGLRTPGGGGTSWEEVAITESPSCRFRWIDKGSCSSQQQQQHPERSQAHARAVDDATVGTARTPLQFSKLCFRVRLSKLFVLEEGNTFKTPVWGDYSQLAAWPDPQPPGPVQKLQISFLSDTFAVVKWALPDNFAQQPGLRFTVTIDPSRAHSRSGKVEAARAEWFTVGTTEHLSCRVDDLWPSSVYRVAVRGQSSFGVATAANIITFTTRSVPNEDPVPRAALLPPTARALIRGLAPLSTAAATQGEEKTRNLFDKYELPKQRRLKALSALAGISVKPRKKSSLIARWQLCAQKAIVVRKRIRERTVALLQAADFDANTDLTPEQRVRVQLGMDPHSSDLVWSDEHFDLTEALDHSLVPDMVVASTFGVMAKKQEDGAVLRKKSASLRLRARSRANASNGSFSVRSMPDCPAGDEDDDVSWVTQQGHPRPLRDCGEASPGPIAPTALPSKKLQPLQLTAKPEKREERRAVLRRELISRPTRANRKRDQPLRPGGGLVSQCNAPCALPNSASASSATGAPTVVTETATAATAEGTLRGCSTLAEAIVPFHAPGLLGPMQHASEGPLPQPPQLTGPPSLRSDDGTMFARNTSDADCGAASSSRSKAPLRTPKARGGGGGGGGGMGSRSGSFHITSPSATPSFRYARSSSSTMLGQRKALAVDPLPPLPRSLAAGYSMLHVQRAESESGAGTPTAQSGPRIAPGAAHEGFGGGGGAGNLVEIHRVPGSDFSLSSLEATTRSASLPRGSVTILDDPLNGGGGSTAGNFAAASPLGDGTGRIAMAATVGPRRVSEQSSEATIGCSADTRRGSDVM